MKRFTKIAVILVVAVVAAGMLTACDFDLNAALKKFEYLYTDTGETEINLNFAALKTDDYKGVNEWDITYVSGETLIEANLVLYTDLSGSIKKTKYVYTTADLVLSIINIRDTSVSPEVFTTWLINETAKTVSDSAQEGFEDIIAAIMIVQYWGIVSLTDEDDSLANWTFVEKRALTIKDMDATDLEVVQFEYEGAREIGTYSDYKLLIDFKKFGITPVIRHIEYESYDENQELDEYIEFFFTLRTGDTPVAADFVVPTAADGYTIQ